MTMEHPLKPTKAMERNRQPPGHIAPLEPDGAAQLPPSLDPNETVFLDVEKDPENDEVAKLNGISPTEFQRMEINAFREMDPLVKSACCKTKVRINTTSGEPNEFGARPLRLICSDCGKSSSFLNCLEIAGHTEIAERLFGEMCRIAWPNSSRIAPDEVDGMVDGMSSLKLRKNEPSSVIHIDEPPRNSEMDPRLAKLLKCVMLSPAEFEELEKLMAKDVRDQLYCPQCLMTGSLMNIKGIAGNTNRVGVRRLALSCKCGSSYLHLRMNKCPMLIPKVKMLKNAMARVEKELEGRETRSTDETKEEQFDPFDEEKAPEIAGTHFDVEKIPEIYEDANGLKESEENPILPLRKPGTRKSQEDQAAEQMKLLKQDVKELKRNMNDMAKTVNLLLKDNRMLKEKNEKLTEENARLKSPGSRAQNVDRSGEQTPRKKSYGEMAASQIPIKKIEQWFKPAQPHTQELGKKTFGKCYMKLNMPRQFKKTQRKVIYAAL